VKKYETIFFDLDHTLWDFEKNSQEALTEIYHELRLDTYGISAPEPFISLYVEHNHRCWEQYRKGEISKDNLRSLRFQLTLDDYEVKDTSLATKIGDEYVNRSPYKTNLFPGALDLLDYLKREYKICIITNGFEEVQYIKIRESGLEKYFDHIITSEKAGVKKPHPDIFHLAMKLSDSVNDQVIMIGDDLEADVLAARNLDIDAVLFDPQKKNELNGDYRIISELSELRNWL
jgi:putative hydrolase of the HAD superfamily